LPDFDLIAVPELDEKYDVFVFDDGFITVLPDVAVLLDDTTLPPVFFGGGVDLPPELDELLDAFGTGLDLLGVGELFEGDGDDLLGDGLLV
jgi:hypothetical protein